MFLFLIYVCTAFSNNIRITSTFLNSLQCTRKMALGWHVFLHLIRHCLSNQPQMKMNKVKYVYAAAPLFVSSYDSKPHRVDDERNTPSSRRWPLCADPRNHQSQSQRLQCSQAAAPVAVCVSAIICRIQILTTCSSGFY